MSKEKQPAVEREGTFGKSLIVFLICVAEIMVGIVVLKLDAHIPIVGAAGIAIICGMTLGIPYSELQGAMVKSVVDSVEAIMVLLMIGPMIAAWMACGTVPYIIYTGLGLLNPGIFLIFVVLMCSLLSSVTGSSWTTVGTIGVAFIGIAMGLGIPVPVAAGAIVCGAYFGDKCSPISDIVVFNTGITKVDIYAHCKNILYTTVPALVVTLVIFGVIGMGHSDGSVDQAAVDTIRNGLAGAYKFSPLLWLPFIVLIASVILKLPSIPALLMGAIAGVLVAVFYQGVDVGTALGFLYGGYSADTGLEAVDKILNRGGMGSMLYTVCLVICSMSMAGVFDRTKILLKLVEKLQAVTQKRVGLIVATMGTGILASYFAADPYIAALIPTKAFENEYDKQGLDRTVLSRTVSDGGICFAPMVPWGSNGVFCSQTLGISVGAYLPYYFMGFLTPIFAIVCAVTGIGIKYAADSMNPKNKDKAAK